MSYREQTIIVEKAGEGPVVEAGDQVAITWKLTMCKNNKLLAKSNEQRPEVFSIDDPDSWWYNTIGMH